MKKTPTTLPATLRLPTPLGGSVARTVGGPADAPIVVLDSGLGGLTVVRALRDALPAEDVVYFGDTARLPYGSKAAATVGQYVCQIIAYLRPLNPRHVVLACNTATALAMPAAAAAFPDLTITGVIEPGARAAAAAAGTRERPVIGVLATEATIRSGAYERAILRRRHHARLLLRPAPLLAPIVEEGRACDDPLVRLAVDQYVGPMVERGMDVLVLGCTHYPLLRPAVEWACGPKVKVIDGAQQSAQDVVRRLRAAGLLRPADAAAADGSPEPVGGFKCFVTDDPARFARLAGRFLGRPVLPPTLVDPDALYRQDAPAARRLRPAG
ncbi:MAG: glutamate racemase [Phycisphaerales bacterium]|nr:glutamate racemase [Phycisphaerales bacterium]